MSPPSKEAVSDSVEITVDLLKWGYSVSLTPTQCRELHAYIEELRGAADDLAARLGDAIHALDGACAATPVWRSDFKRRRPVMNQALTRWAKAKEQNNSHE